MNSNLLGKTRSYKFFNFEYTWTEIISIKGVKISQSHVKKTEVTTLGPAVHLFFFINRSSIFDGFLC